MARTLLYKAVIVFWIILGPSIDCHEKTLRKIVRNQSKMVPRPFSEGMAPISWSSSKLSGNHDKLQFMNSLIHVIRPKMTTINSPDTVKGKISYSTVHNKSPNELRKARNINGTNSNNNRTPMDEKPIAYRTQLSNNSFSYNITLDRLYTIPPSNFFPPIEDRETDNVDKQSSKENTIIIPNLGGPEKNRYLLQRIFMAHPDLGQPEASHQMDANPNLTSDNSEGPDKTDFILQEPAVDDTYFQYNLTVNPYICTPTVQEAWTDINTQLKFNDFDIEPSWVSKKHFWNRIYDSRYESLMRNVKWPALKVILIPRSHVDSIWTKTFFEYHNQSVSKILSNAIKKLQFYKNLTFSWNEVSHLSYWWKCTTQKNRLAFKKLLKSGRLEITTGGWVETDEATTNLFSLVHLFIEGHEWLKYNLNYSPKVGWLTNSVTHSPTVTYLLSILDIPYLIVTNLHYAWEQFLAEYQDTDFIWVQNWDDDKQSLTTLNKNLYSIGKERNPKHAVLTHYLPFNSAGFKGCGPNTAVCVNDFDFAKSNKNIDLNTYNIKDKSEIILEQYSKTGTTSSHNTVIAPLGGPFAYSTQSEFDYQYNNYEKIADFINHNQGIYKATVEFGTPTTYFNSVAANYGNRGPKFPTLQGDFINFADIKSGRPAYWVGYFTSRPFLKIMLRRLEHTLRTTEILFSFACSYNVFKRTNRTLYVKDLIVIRETVARLLDRNVVSGTLPVNVLRNVHDEILQTVNKCWEIQEASVSLLTSKPEVQESFIQKYVYREGEFMSTFKTVSPGDQVYLFNSLSHERSEVIELITRHPNVRVIDHNKKDLTIQINPVWKYSTDNHIKISKRFYKMNFVVVLPPMTLELFIIKDTYDVRRNAANVYCSSCVVDNMSGSGSIFPFIIQPVKTGDIQLESYKHRLVFDEMSGFLKTLIEKETNIAKNVLIDFGAFRDSNVNSGMFLFNTNVTKPIQDILLPYRVGSKTKVVIITTGPIITEITTVYGRLLHQTVRLFNLRNSALSQAIYLESKVDFEVSPKNRDLELFMSIQTDINTGNPPQIITDNNGFQFSTRILNISRRIESNIYPITNMVFIEDNKNRLTYLTDHAQGVTALQEGQLLVLLERRVLFDDGRGASEGLADSSATCHRAYILLESMEVSAESTYKPTLKEPSLTAVFLSNALNYLQDIFVVDKHKTRSPFYSFMPLIKISFPCDVSVVNFRAVLRGAVSYPNHALLVLHRRSYSCDIVSRQLSCNGDSTFSVDKIMRNLNAVFLTNLAGTVKGSPVYRFTLANFPPMELKTLRIYF